MTKAKFVVPTTDDWSNTYTPVENHIDQNASFDFGNGYGSMFETYGPELEFVISIAKTKPQTVWTLVDSDGDDLYIIAGYHLVNRVGYFITAQEWESEDEQYLVN